MTSPRPRRPRVIRPAGTVGTDDSVLISSHPAQPAAPAKPAAQPAETRERAVPFRAADDSDVGWGERNDANDDRLRQDKPPHW
ncbi:hypothetical protein [Cellulomonas rhizosphaerae]|uniref:Uncharacterized protein n=1 Tax=Cellulomonas rhizosphaerae TaxID=2293719 RepID=A0A413RQJ1_9CELL|nr:hypothetical protein [Cellulomonas rhizosphaerae]RHA44204.1 hypothetical protein D1825_02420 [Cellulomonas rhizosphaerae]